MVFRKSVAGSALDVPIASLLDTDIDFELQKDPSDKTSSSSLKISAEERDILHMVDGTSTVQDIVDTTPMGEFDVYRLLYELATRNLIEEVKVSAAASAAAAAEADSVRRWVAVALQVGVFALAALGVAGLRSNPISPWRLASGSHETELLKTYASRSRMERLERALQIYYLDRGTMPQTLSGLADEGFLTPADVVDPWGHPYEYRVDASGYEIAGSAPPGDQPDDLVVRHAFSASQRMVLEGGATERDRPSAP
jgi:hypothetical protein